MSLNRQLGHISVATGRIPSLFCGNHCVGVKIIEHKRENPDTMLYKTIKE